jgi:N-glycosylase/DNA lyase
MKIFDIKDLERVKLCDSKDLNLLVCIGRGGQSFSWVPIEGDKCWANILENSLIILEYNEDSVFYFKSCERTDYDGILKRYFNLGYDLQGLTEKWFMNTILDQRSLKRGVRIIKEDPFEAFISFLCSQNNAISRITKMVQNILKEFGQIEYVLIDNESKFQIYKFPKPELLVDSSEKLNQLGFGYRSKFIAESCKVLVDHRPNNFFYEMLDWPYDRVIEELQKFPGVGPKVADCIALFGFGKLESVPIDRHILKVANKFGFIEKNFSSLTPKTYRIIGDKFRKLFGPLAGWAHSLLFTNQLSSFKSK